jgi:coenzyme F420-reducing hydrogenase alpha subunit
VAHNVLNHYIAKIEGHGQLKYSNKENLVRIEIDEGERLFERLVIGKSYKDIAFITARICGVCPTAHTMAAIDAIEDAFDVEPNNSIKNLRQALVAAQIVQSHALHLFFLALPDYLGVKNGLELHDKNPRVFKLASSLKGTADRVIEVIGGRAVHPVSPTVGGFLSIPERKAIEALITEVRHAYRLAQETLDLFAHFRYPYLDRKTEYFSLTENNLISTTGNTLVSSGGVETQVTNYQYIITEKVKSYSTAKFAVHEGHGMMVGAIARVNMMKDTEFNPKTKKAIDEFKIKLPLTNGFKNNLAQAIELLHYFEEIEARLTDYLWGKNERTKVGFRVRAGVGVGAVEAPRGTLYHMYEFDDKGICTRCDIVTPTVQNLTNLEDDANEYLRQNKSVTIPRREKELEMLIRAYDPCLTCSVH